jgi:hypothetical protein
MMSEAAATLPGARGRLARDSRQGGGAALFHFFLFLFGEDQEALLFGDAFVKTRNSAIDLKFCLGFWRSEYERRGAEK